MAETDFGALSALRKRVYLNQVEVQGRHQSFFDSNGFISQNETNKGLPITRVTELTTTGRGIVAVMPMVTDLDVNKTVVGDNEVTGNESTLGEDVQTITYDQLRHGVKSAGRMSEQATVIKFRATAQERLAFWKADLRDELTFLTASGRAYSLTYNGAARAANQLTSLNFAADVSAATTNRIVYAGAATSEATLTAADTMSWDVVLKAVTHAKRKAIAPIRNGGRNYYALVMSSEQFRDLVISPDYKAIVSTAEARGKDNPLFSNAKVVVGGVIIYEHQKVYHTLGGTAWGGGTVHGAQALLLGASAIGMVDLPELDTLEESDVNDYKNKPGIAMGFAFGLKKSVWKSKYDADAKEDTAIISVKTAAAA